MQLPLYALALWTSLAAPPLSSRPHAAFWRAASAASTAGADSVEATPTAALAASSGRAANDAGRRAGARDEQPMAPDTMTPGAPARLAVAGLGDELSVQPSAQPRPATGPTRTAAPAAAALPAAADGESDAPDAPTTPALDGLLPPDSPPGDAPLDDDAVPPAKAVTDELPDNSSDLTVDVDRWLLHDMLSEGVAQTPYWRANFAEARAAVSPSSHNDLDDWQDRLRMARASAMLAGQPQQHHAVNAQALRFNIPLASHPLVDLYIDYFTGRGRWFFERWLNRGSQVMPMMREILAAEGVPEDLVYLAMVESGFSAHAYSSAAAVGYWQFIASTGSTYGLTRDRFVDERRDFVRATHGAARFLSTLHRHLGDWHLAWASYNAGEGRIRRAMNKTGAKTFWQLIARNHGLAKETVHYVPKIIAAAIVAKDAARYGFHPAQAVPLKFDTVPVRGALELAILAREARCSLDELRALNPSLLYGVTPPGRTSQLRIPTGTRNAVQTALARLPVQRRVTYAAYKVRKGDTLSGIARRMSSNVETLRQFNALTNKPLRPGTQLVVPSFRLAATPPPAARPQLRVARAQTGKKTTLASFVGRSPPKRPSLRVSRRGRARAHHVVASGETLWSIARRYGVSLEQVQGRKKRGGDRIAVGEVIDIF